MFNGDTMSDQGKGDTRRPMTIDPTQLEINWTNTFDKRNDERIQETTRNTNDNEYGYNRRYSR